MELFRITYSLVGAFELLVLRHQLSFSLDVCKHLLAHQHLV